MRLSRLHNSLGSVFGGCGQVRLDMGGCKELHACGCGFLSCKSIRCPSLRLETHLQRASRGGATLQDRSSCPWEAPPRSAGTRRAGMSNVDMRGLAQAYPYALQAARRVVQSWSVGQQGGFVALGRRASVEAGGQKGSAGGRGRSFGIVNPRQNRYPLQAPWSTSLKRQAGRPGKSSEERLGELRRGQLLKRALA